jgi:two-component system, cell cycle response regulator DivK
MDISLPGLDGLDATQFLKRNPRTRDIPIIAVTAHAMVGDEERAMSAGCDGYLSKPISWKLLLEIIEKHI